MHSRCKHHGACGAVPLGAEICFSILPRVEPAPGTTEQIAEECGGSVGSCLGVPKNSMAARSRIAEERGGGSFSGAPVAEKSWGVGAAGPFSSTKGC